MVTMLRPAPARPCAIRSFNSDVIDSRYRFLEPSALCKRRSGGGNAANERLKAPSGSVAAGIVCCSGRDEFTLRLGSFNRIRMLDLKVLRRREIGWKQGRSLLVVCASEGEGETQRSRLGSIIKNKQRIIESQLRSMAEGELESRLALTKAVTKPYSLLDTIAQQIMEGRTAIVVEVARLSPAETPEMLAERCVKYVKWGKKCFAKLISESSQSVHPPINPFCM